MSNGFRSIAAMFALLLLGGALHAAPPPPPGGATTRPKLTPPPAPAPTFRLQPGCAGPAPQVQVSTHAVYVQLTWSSVPGSRTYWVGRSVPSRSGSGVKLTTDNFLQTEYWDAVPDPRDTYQYTVTAVDPNGCTGSTSVAVAGPFATPNPKSLGSGRPDAMQVVLIFSEQFGAISYRIDGPGIPITGQYINGTTFVPGKKPTYIGTPRQTSGTTVYDMSVTVASAGVGAATYTVSAQYPGASDYANPAKIWVPRVMPIITSISPSGGTLGQTLVKITGKYLSDPGDVEPPVVRFGVPQGGATPTNPGKQVPTKSVSPTEITAYGAASGYVQVTTRTTAPMGTSTISAVSPTAWSGTPPLVLVPGVVGLSLNGAMQVLRQDGFVPIGGSGPTGTNAIVQKQTPAGGARAPQGSTVSLMTVAAARGYSELTLYNNMQQQRGVNVWLFDQAANSWSGGSSLGYHATTTLNLKSGRMYFVLVLDPGKCGGQNNYADSNCEYWRLPGVPGDEDGPTTAVAIN
jgi:PASTA domain-containing protein